MKPTKIRKAPVDNITLLQSLLKKAPRTNRPAHTFFKTGPGEYAEHDKFLSIKVSEIRVIAKKFTHLTLNELSELLASPYNDERLLALVILVHQYSKANPTDQQKIYEFYLENIRQVNNWNLVDSSAHLIVGAHIEDKSHDVLISLAHSADLWKRRIAIISTWHFIKKWKFETTIVIATLLLHDTHDLIHKAVGWMLREMGKKDVTQLIVFLDAHAHVMPRTMLSYALEKLSQEERVYYLSRTKHLQ